MANNIVDKLKLKSGEYYDFKPEGYDELVAKVSELVALVNSGSEPISPVDPDAPVVEEVEEEVVVIKKILAKSNRKKTQITVTYTKNDGTTATVTKTLAKADTSYYMVSNETNMNTSEPIIYTAKIVDGSNNVVEQLTGQVNVSSSTNTTIQLSFTQTVPATYYLRVNGYEERWPMFRINHDTNTFTLNIESNIQYSVNIYSNIYIDNDRTKGLDYSFFTVDGVQPTSNVYLRNCSGNKTIEFTFTDYNYTPNSISDFGPRTPETYSMNAYSYINPDNDTTQMYRGVNITISADGDQYDDDIETRFPKIIQNSVYAEEANQVVELDLSDEQRTGYLCPTGGSFQFRIKPHCYWYIYNEFESGFGVPNYMTFSPSEGGPSDSWQTITASWTSDKAHPSMIRDILVKICSVINDQVICEKTWDGATYKTISWRLLGSQYTTDPSGETSNNGESPSRAYLETLGFGVMNAFVGVGVTQYGELYPNNKLELYREAREVKLYVKSNINWRLETGSLPACVQNMTYLGTPYGSSNTEGKPGQHMYKFTLAENDTNADRDINIQITSTDSRFTGTSICTITQHGTYLNDRGPDHARYSLIKEANLWPFESEYNSLSINALCKYPYVISDKNYDVSSQKFYSAYTFGNYHPANTEFDEINLTNIEILPEEDYEKYRAHLYILMKYSSGTIHDGGSDVQLFRLGVPQKIKKVLG